jgi:hypothetical protein
LSDTALARPGGAASTYLLEHANRVEEDASSPRARVVPVGEVGPGRLEDECQATLDRQGHILSLQHRTQVAQYVMWRFVGTGVSEVAYE